MNKDNASKLWKIIQEAGDYLNGQLPDHPNHPKGRNPYAHVAICVKNKFNASYKDIEDDKFNEVLNFDGVILTKLDGDTRGGAALTIRSVVDKPIKFIGTSEKMEGLDVFHPERMASRILGMGDVISLVERAQQQFDEQEARKIQKKIAKNTFGFDDFLINSAACLI